MDRKNRQITLFVSQRREIIRNLEMGKHHYVKMKYIKEKYAEVADVFVLPYLWFVKAGEKIVKRPKEAESAVWAYGSLSSVEIFPELEILELSVPMEACIFFTMEDWTKRLNGLYIGLDEADEKDFKQEIKDKGIGYMGEIIHSNFYPAEKQKIESSWMRLFDLDKQIKEDTLEEYPMDLQAGLWEIDPKWMVKNMTTKMIYTP